MDDVTERTPAGLPAPGAAGTGNDPEPM